MFIDEARIRIKAGDGGNGCMAFRREKFVPRGGPSGGDGGHGGDILMSSSLSHNTLVHFRFNPEHKSKRGEHGMGSNCSGQSAEHLVLKVPVGTLLYDDDTGELVHDFARPDETIVIARGGRGGRGNQHFATSTHQAPREHELGRPGEARNYRLELRLLADAGLVGYPNVGKSTLISRLSAAKPKIANYAFTTLQPNLGVVQVGEFPHTESFTIADLPGLIEGAHLGHGLGIQFLKHIERTSVIVHLVDVSDSGATEGTARPDAVADFKVITEELRSFDPSLATRPTIVVATKCDVANPDKLKKLTAMAKRRKLPFFAISAVTGEGIEPLKYAIAEAVAAHRPARIEIEAVVETLPKTGEKIRHKSNYPPPAPSARRRG
ncbi:GTPase ObgE [Edaphobacter dinghuensis]|uniref:GTPase Obg n=1 Tax=Edaphobacter dinghuensis TaxID=1560005 RepID=A0A917H4V2_9BACT|nr:GTPase ObgE [Edaphobacter dinghuensis]GGG67469.1 GTPase ObgE [Edaphobacter dinghuensis]